MEIRPEFSHGVEIPKKSRSLDLKSLYSSNMDSKPRSKRKGSVGSGSDEKRPERKKSRKALSISGFKFLSRNGSKSLEEVYNGCFSMSSHDSMDSKSGPSQGQNRDGNGGFSCILKGLNDGVANVPRRKRDFVGRRKVETGGVVVKLVHDVGDIDIVGWLAGQDEGPNSESLKAEVKRDAGGEAPKEHGNCEVNSDKHSTEDAQASDSAGKCGDSVLKKSGSEHAVENNVDPLLKTSFRKRSRKRKKVVPPVVESVTAEAQPPADTSFQVPGDLREDEEENLEENAARMLSSRFDPGCTEFSNGNATPGNGASINSSSGRKLSKGSTFGSGNRALRPRNQDKEGKSKVRRNYYRIFGDLDPYWAVNRRIKIFWPLDKTWYSGHVVNYDDERKLHHINYDDRDEEWVDLRNERFKLLLFPSEVPGRANRKRLGTRRKHVDEESGKLKVSKRKKRVLTSENDSRLGNDADAEPIISWLSRSAAKAKPSPLQALKKKEKRSHLSGGIPKLLSEEAANGDRLPFYPDDKELCVHDQVAAQRREASVMETSNCAEDKKLLVYHRKRFHKIRGALYHMAKAKHVSPNVPNFDAFTPVVFHGVIEEYDIFSSKLDVDGSLGSVDATEAFWSTSSSGWLELNIPLMESRDLKFKLSFPLTSCPNYSFGRENFGLFHAASLLQYGTVIALWPRVYLEMLFVDNIVGLRRFVLEGSLKHAVAFLFLVLAAFQCKEQQKCDDLGFPKTSVRFKFSCIQDGRKQLVFAFCNFYVAENAKWMYLDKKLRKHCFLFQQLPLSECTYDNLKVLQNGRSRLIKSSVLEDSSPTKGMQKKSKQGLGLMNISRETIRVNAIQSSAFDQDQRLFPLSALSFTAAPTLFLGLHLKLLMERSENHISLQNCHATDCMEESGNLLADACSIMKDCSDKGADGKYDHVIKNLLKDSGVDRSSSFKLSEPKVVDGCQPAGVRSFRMHQSGDGNTETCATPAMTSCPSKSAVDSLVPTLKQKCRNAESEQADLLPQVLGNGSKPDCVPHYQDGITIDVPSFGKLGIGSDKLDGAQPHADWSWNMSGGIIPSPNPTARRSTWHRNRNNSASFGSLSHGWLDNRGEFLQNNFTTGPKKPRTQVSYTLPVGGFDSGSKNKGHHSKELPHKRIRTLHDKKLHDGSKCPEKNLESLSCCANVLVTLGDRGWRECGAQVVLQLFDHNEWRLAVKVSGSTKFSYKANQFLQPGSTNRYTHAMMWKGGKDWVLEFIDRSQWALFKEMHEECHNRNIRAASVKNIPIPGVCLIEDDENGVEVPFFRSLKYFRQVETDVEMALNPSKVLYDMDSDDEDWILRTYTSSGAESSITLDMFEKIMDKFEKVAYSQQRDQLTTDDIEDFMAGVAPIEVTKSIHEYWQQKRQRRGMPLIRHLQPPLWEKYHQEVKEWELALTKNNGIMLNVRHEKATLIEKPLMFAFCLKPRGLELLNKGSKQRSHRKISVAGQSNSFCGDHDGFHYNGRRVNGFAFWDERYSYELLEESPYPQVSPRVISPWDVAGTGVSLNGDRFGRNHLRKLQRSKSRKFTSFNECLMVSSCNQRMLDNGNGYHWLDMDYFDSPRQLPYYDRSKHIPEQLDGPDLDEFRLRGASGAAQHAVNLAKLKRERAQRLLYRADLAIHKAVGALMTAESMKASSKDVNSDV